MWIERIKNYIASKKSYFPFLYKAIKKFYHFLFEITLFIPCKISTRNSFIPIVAPPEDFNRVIRAGKFAGKKCYYKTGLFNTLIKLRPRICLEIGTYYGGTARVFERYFKKYRRDGLLITADIKKYKDIEGKYIIQVVVYPHVGNIGKYHNVFRKDLLPDAEKKMGNSLEENCKILKEELKKIGAEYFDFSFIDGDHQRISFLRDIEIARRLSNSPHYILLDDTKDEAHESAFVYQGEIKNRFNHYDFEDWPIFVGMSLIWDKNL